jgi:ParB-like chromosome segregation protein Spo0J
MARRRLAPLSALADVPRAEHPPHAALHAAPLAPGLPAAPIARVAAEAAGSAALAELADTLARARETGRLVLDLSLDAIAPDHLARDRIGDRMPVEDAEMEALRASIRAHGQRTPVEVVAMPAGSALPWGLLSGWRRLAALRTLHAETGDDRFATVQALVRRPETAADAYVAMVEENEIRLGLSQYERARVAARTAARGVFADEEAALRALFGTASRPKRSRIRAFVELYHGLDAHLRFPAAIPERLGLALVERLREGRGPAIAAALAEAAPATTEAELALLDRLARPAAAPRPAPAARALAPGLALETRLAAGRLTLTLKGRAVDEGLAARVEAAIAAVLGAPEPEAPGTPR